MELRFDSRTMKYLSRVLQEAKCQEETMETIVPDSFPDVDRVLCGNAVVVMRSKECRTGSAVVSGGIRANALYMAEGEKCPRCLEVYLPFTVKVEDAALTESAQVLFCAHARNVDVRMLNSRKLVIRVNLCWQMTAYDTCQQTLCVPENPPESLQLHTVEYPMLLPVETAERSFQMTEDLSLPARYPLVGSVYQFTPRLEITEQRLAGNKAVFKGLVRLRMLYGTEGDNVAVHETEIPFSQYCELAQVYDEEEMQLQMALTGCEVERAVQPDGEGLVLSLHILAQCVVNRQEIVSLTEDAYSLDGEFVPQWQECAFACRLDRQVFSRMVREGREGSISDVVDAWCCADHPQMTRVSGGMEVTTPVLVSILYRDGQGDLQSMSFRSESTEKINLAENVRCTAMADVGDVTAISTGSGIELRYPVSTTVESVVDGNYRTLCGGEIRETEQRRVMRPAVIVRRTRSGESLWDIAKASGTTVEKIRRANHMDAEFTDAGVLLIPM